MCKEVERGGAGWGGAEQGRAEQSKAICDVVATDQIDSYKGKTMDVDDGRDDLEKSMRRRTLAHWHRRAKRDRSRANKDRTVAAAAARQVRDGDDVVFLLLSRNQ